MNFSQGHSGTKVQCESCLFSQGKAPEFTKMGEIHELSVLPLSLVWFAGPTPDSCNVQVKCVVHRSESSPFINPEGREWGVGPVVVDFRVSGGPDFQSRGSKILILKGFGASGRKIGAPQKRENQPRRIQPPILGPLRNLSQRMSHEVCLHTSLQFGLILRASVLQSESLSFSLLLVEVSCYVKL